MQNAYYKHIFYSCMDISSWCVSMLCFCCAQISMRKKALNHVNPGSDWNDYKCCQGKILILIYLPMKSQIQTYNLII